MFSWSIQYKKLEENSFGKAKLRKEITETMLHRQHLDGSIAAVGVFLFGPIKGSSVLSSVRKPGLPLVDDWECLKSTVIQESAPKCSKWSSKFTDFHEFLKT